MMVALGGFFRGALRRAAAADCGKQHVNRIFSSDAPKRRRVRSFSSRAACAAAAFCALSLGVDDFVGQASPGAFFGEFSCGKGRLAPARQSRPSRTPFEVGASLSGNYLAAIVAGAQRDTLAASTFFREALRNDPRNTRSDRPRLRRRARQRQYAGGLLSRRAAWSRMTARTASRISRCGVDAIKARKFAARAHESRQGRRRPSSHDITSTLLTAWSLCRRRRDKQRAWQRVDKLKEDAFVGVPRLSCGADRRSRRRQGGG